MLGSVISKPLLYVLVPVAIVVIASIFLEDEKHPQEIINEQVLICNEQQLQDQLDAEVQLREDAEQLASSLRSQLSASLNQQAENSQYIRDLQTQLDSMNLDDDEISPRTRELLNRLNAKTLTIINGENGE